MSSRTLILMRHARQDVGGIRDHERPLTADGRDDARAVGERLRDEGPRPGLALVSTARRCRETWETIASTLPSAVATEFEGALYNASARELLGQAPIFSAMATAARNHPQDSQSRPIFSVSAAARVIRAYCGPSRIIG